MPSPDGQPQLVRVSSAGQAPFAFLPRSHWMAPLSRPVALLADRAPRLDRALNRITRAGGEAVLLDGTLIRTRRRTAAANRKNYSLKHRSHGLLFLALTDERGNLIWISSARRGAASEIKAARHDKLCEHLRTAGLGALADLGFVGLDQDPDYPVVNTGVKRTRKKNLNRRAETGQPDHRRRPRTRRARLRRPEDIWWG